jgi:ribosomal protein L11 methylase PrmA
MMGSLAADGVALLSGILVEERDLMIRAIDRAGLRVDSEDVEGDWLSILASRVS